MKRVSQNLCLCLLAAGVATASQSLLAAERVKLQGADPALLKQAAVPSASALQQALSLSPSNSFHLLRENRDAAGKTHARYEQRYQGVPVYGEQVLIHRDASGQVQALTGVAVDGIENDVADSALTNPAISSQAALAKAKQKVGRYIVSRHGVSPVFRNEKVQLVIYLDANQTAHVAWYINYVAEVPGADPARPYFIIDATDGRILKTWDGMAHAEIGTGPGGNTKRGLIEYGSAGVPFLDVAQAGPTCTMQTAEVQTVNLNGGFSGSTPYSYACPRNTFQTVNGGYAPLNDAHFYAKVTNDMFKSYVGTTPLSGPFILRVHYGTAYENAFWDGAYTSFGDGADMFFPLSTSLNVVAHESTHGNTEQNSGLEYYGQSGGINEAYSDIAGEAAEYYLNGSVDWLVGAEVMKKAKALRYFEDPTKDKKSIKHAGDYYDGINVHYSSGVFNRAYFLLSNTAGWDPAKAFKVFYFANVNYWTPLSNYVDAACGVLSATDDLAYSKVDVDAAFKAVGVNCPAPLVDVDSDYMDDTWENSHGLNPSVNDAAGDADGDGVTNLQEFLAGTNPQDTDSDNDGVDDSADPLPLDGDWLHLFAESSIANKDDTKGAQAGFSVSTGDFDGDGVSDFIVGAPYFDYKYGRSRYPDIGFAAVISGATGKAVWFNIGGGKGQLYGWSVAGTSDLDNDGVDDLVSGAPGTYFDWGSYRYLKKAGQVFFYSLFDVDMFSGLPTSFNEMQGDSANDRMGFAVSGIKSAGLGGYGWVAVGVPGLWTTDGSNVFRNAGAVYVYRPGWASTPIANYYGGETNGGLGSAVAGIGDITGDGWGDLAIGMPWADSNNGKDTGAVHLVTPINDGYHDLMLVGLTKGERFGASIAGGGDIDGDSLADDFVIGAPYANGQAGLVSVWLGASSSATLNAGVSLPQGTQAKGLMGTSVAIVRDVNADGRDDILVGSPGMKAVDAGTGKTLAAAGLVQLFSGNNGAELNSWAGKAAKDNLGSAVASGDLNGDGKGDLVMVAKGRDVSGGTANKPKTVKDAGEVRVFNGTNAP